MKRILVTGACGQIGSELVVWLGEEYGRQNVVSTDIRQAPAEIDRNSHFMYLNVLEKHDLAKIVVDHHIDTIFHMAAILSASGELDPQLAYRINLEGLMNVLEVARKKGVTKLITPSSIAVFGPDAPKVNTPDNTPLNPTTMYGVTKVAGEKLLDYYFLKYGLDSRSLRFPGIISSATEPGGGTTDFAIDMYVHAVSGEAYQCFVRRETALPFMYMPDAIRAIQTLSEADSAGLQRRTYNVHAMRLTAGEIADAIAAQIPEFRCQFVPDSRQAIADSWPESLDDHLARQQWGWLPEHDLPSMTADMLMRLRAAR